MSKIKVVTHNGKFHADDVFSVALVSLLETNKELEIIRTRDEKVFETADWLLDVGGKIDILKKQFDHHQIGYSEKRISNGLIYATIGLLWREYGEKLVGSKEAAENIDKKLIEYVDAGDNGVSCKTQKDIVHAYTVYDLLDEALNPTWREADQDGDDNLSRFLQAVEIAKVILKREIKRAQDFVLDKQIILDIYNKTEDKRVLIFDKHYAWRSIVANLPEVTFIVGYDKPNDKWRLATVEEDETLIPRKSLPASWAGKKGKELQEITGVDDADFCHNKLFISGSKSLAGALKMAKLALEN